MFLNKYETGEIFKVSELQVVIVWLTGSMFTNKTGTGTGTSTRGVPRAKAENLNRGESHGVIICFHMTLTMFSSGSRHYLSYGTFLFKLRK
jgi:hypothetical protein